jgi:UTP--glucose-1-phosphate uridylyltransferase
VGRIDVVGRKELDILPVTKAVFPVAGLGTRFLPATKSIPKEMLPIVDRPTIEYSVEEAIKSGIEDFLFVTGRDKKSLDDYFDHSLELEQHLLKRGQKQILERVKSIPNMCNVHCIRQKQPLGLGHAVSRARYHVPDGYFAVILPDDIVVSEEPCLAQMLKVHEKTKKAVIAVERVPRDRISSYGIIEGTREGDTWTVSDLVEKPKPEDAPSDMGIIGRYILPASIFEAIDRTLPGHGGEIQLTDALRELAKEGSLIAYEFKGKRYDVGNPMGFLMATVEFALAREDLGSFMREYLNSLKL